MQSSAGRTRVLIVDDSALVRKVLSELLATDRSIDDVVIDDGYSAKDLNRPGIARLLEDVRAGR